MNQPIIRCTHKKRVKLTELKPHPKNPNTHPKDQINLLAKIITHQGWRSPIVVSERSGFIVAGHGRYEAAKLLGLKDAPVDVQEFDSEADELAHLIADNQIAELSELSKPMLQSVLTELQAMKIDMDMTGFLDDEMKTIIAKTITGKSTREIDTSEFSLKCKCPKCGMEFDPPNE